MCDGLLMRVAAMSARALGEGVIQPWRPRSAAIRAGAAREASKATPRAGICRGAQVLNIARAPLMQASRREPRRSLTSREYKNSIAHDVQVSPARPGALWRGPAAT